MPADFLLSTITNAPSRDVAPRASDIFQLNQSDTPASRPQFQGQFQREVRRSSEARRREESSFAREDRPPVARREASEPARGSSQSQPGGKSLPARAEQADYDEARDTAAPNRAQTKTGAIDAQQRNAEQPGQSSADVQNEDYQKFLSQEYRQTLEALRDQLAALQVDQMTAEEQQEILHRLAEWAEEIGLDLSELSSQLENLASSQSLAAGEDLGDLSGVLAQLRAKIFNETDVKDGDIVSRDEAPIRTEGELQATELTAVLENIKQWVTGLLDQLPSRDHVSSNSNVEMAQGDHPEADLSADLTTLLAGQSFTLSPGMSAGAGEAATLSPWGLTRLQSGGASMAGSTLTDRVTALSPHRQDSSADPSLAEESDNAASALASDLDFLAKHSDKLSAKAKMSLGDLNLMDLANQAQQLSKDGSGPLQQKIQDLVAQIKVAMGESAKADAAALDGASKTNAAQPVSAFMRTLEQASGPQAAKAQMTMQNHFSRPAWAGELGQRLVMMVGQKIQVAEIRLDPPDLGPMEVKVRMHQDQAHVVFQSQHAAVRDALEQAIPRLREMFDQNGLGLGNVDVQDQTAQQRQGQDQDGGSQLAGADSLDADGDSAVGDTVTVASSDRLVDYYA